MCLTPSLPSSESSPISRAPLFEELAHLSMLLIFNYQLCASAEKRTTWSNKLTLVTLVLEGWNLFRLMSISFTVKGGDTTATPVSLTFNTVGEMPNNRSNEPYQFGL